MSQIFVCRQFEASQPCREVKAMLVNHLIF